eukprot:3758835-Karenia_brevis.AAC.1
MSPSGHYTEPAGSMEDPGGLIFVTVGGKNANMSLSGSSKAPGIMLDRGGLIFATFGRKDVNMALSGSYTEAFGFMWDPSWTAHFCNFRSKRCKYDPLGILHGAIWINADANMILSGCYKEPPDSMENSGGLICATFG